MTVTRFALATLAFVMGAVAPPLAMGGESATGTSQAESSRRIDKAAKAAAARESGEWTVEKGESLLRICRYLSDDPSTRRALAVAILEDNPGAFANGDRAMLVPGSRLRLRGPPDRLSSAPTKAPPDSDPGKVANGHRNGKPAANGRRPLAAASTPPNGQNGSRSANRNGEARNGSSPPAPPYRDLLIEGLPEEPESEMAGRREGEPGRRYFSAEYRSEIRQSDRGARGYQQGIGLQYRHETANYGEFFIDAAGFVDHPPAGGDRSARMDSSRVALYHNAFPVREGWVADSILGVLRTPPSLLFNQSYRIFLPTSLVVGASTVASSSTTDVKAFAGNVGRIEGVFGQGFETAGGQLAGVGFAHYIRPGLLAGAQWIRLRDARDVPDHDSVTAAVEFSPSNAEKVKVQALSSDNGRNGLWVDADWVNGRLRQRAGAFHLDRDLLWAESAILNDQQGGYWRGDFSSLRTTASYGLDVFRTNVRGEPGREGTDTVAAYGSFNLRLDRSLTAGGGLTLQSIDSRTGTGIDSRSISGNAFASRLSEWGISRVDLSGYLARPEWGPRDRILAATLSQDWEMPGHFTATSSIALSREDANGRERRFTTLGFLLRGPQVGPFIWDLSASWTDIESESGDERNWNFSGNLHWPITRHWTAQAQISRNAIDLGPVMPGTLPPPLQKDQRIQLGLRYEFATGIPYASLGLARGQGSGVVGGIIFFDENGDGIQQVTERGASNVTLYLDGRFPATTDSSGRFQFPPVASGSHSVRVLVEGLPLPWVLDDDKPRTILVPLRGEANVTIPLTRIRP